MKISRPYFEMTELGHISAREKTEAALRREEHASFRQFCGDRSSSDSQCLGDSDGLILGSESPEQGYENAR